MKKIFLLCASVLGLASCSEISTDPAPALPTRTQSVSVKYALTASTLPDDTLLVNPKLEVYLVNPTVNSDGTLSYPKTATNPVATITDFSNPMPITVGNVVVADGQPAAFVRLVFSSDNLPGRRKEAQSLTTTLVVNGQDKVKTTYTGKDFKLPSANPAPPFFKRTDLSVAFY